MIDLKKLDNEKYRSFTENRKLGMAVLAVVIILSVLLSGGGKLGAKRGEALDVFKNGDGYGSVSDDIARRVECAYDLHSTAARYEAIPADTVRKVETLTAKLEKAEPGTEMEQLHKDLSRAVEDLYSAIENASLSASDAEYAKGEYKEFVSRGMTMSRDAYNEAAEKYNKLAGGFPAALVAGLTGNGALPVFE